MADLDASRCPLCGRANQCAMAADPGRPGNATACAGCWCATATIPTDVLARVPTSKRNLACICRECAGATGTDPDQSGRASD